MKLILVVIGLALILMLSPGYAQEQGGEQIRVDDFCRVYKERLKKRLESSLYIKAVQRKKEGRLLPDSRARLEYVEHLRAGLKAAKCSK